MFRAALALLGVGQHGHIETGSGHHVERASVADGGVDAATVAAGDDADDLFDVARRSRPEAKIRGTARTTASAVVVPTIASEAAPRFRRLRRR